MLAVTGTGLNTLKMLANDGKVRMLHNSALWSNLPCSHSVALQPPRYNMDEWDLMMMERDRRLTGSTRGQSVSPSAGLAFPDREGNAS